MKKIVLASLMVALAVCASCKFRNANIYMRTAFVSVSQGNVAITQSNIVKTGSIGMAVTEGATIETGADSFIEIYMGENAVRITQKSSITIDQLSYNIKNDAYVTQFTISAGGICSVIPAQLAPNDRYTVVAGNASASVHGTEFFVSEEEGKTTISCLNGKIDALDLNNTGGKPALIEGGQSAVFVKGKKVTVDILDQQKMQELSGLVTAIRHPDEDLKKLIDNEYAGMQKKIEKFRGKKKI